MINALILASGSKGNATLIYSEKTNILLDLGISPKSCNEKLSKIGKNLSEVQYFLFTHNHSDHIKFYKEVPVDNRYALKNVIELPKENTLKLFTEYQFGDFKVIPIKANHDAETTCGYLFKNGEEELVYLTDTGMIGKKTLSYIKNKDYYIIESNHDVDMLLQSNRPQFLIDRIMSNKGHLSNEDSAFYMTSLVGEKTKKIILAHLSEECNTPEIALNTYRKVFKFKKTSLTNIDLKCAKQYEEVSLW